MEKATKEQLNALEMMLLAETIKDKRFFYLQGYFINNAKSKMSLNEANQIIRYIHGKNKKRPDCFNQFICFDYGWNKKAIKAVGLAENKEGLPFFLKEKIEKGEITKNEALQKVKTMAKERDEYLDKCIDEYFN